jgi:hypothetical protein
MATTLAISIDLPPTGELETSGNGSSPTDIQMAEEEKARQKFLDAVSPYLASVPKRPPHRQANVSSIELLGTGIWSQLNHYLLLVTVDLGDPGIDKELLALLPKGSKVTTVGSYQPLQTWSTGPMALSA